MRATNGVARHKRKKRIMKSVKGYYGRRHLLLRTAIEAQHDAATAWQSVASVMLRDPAFVAY